MSFLRDLKFLNDPLDLMQLLLIYDLQEPDYKGSQIKSVLAIVASLLLLQKLLKTYLKKKILKILKVFKRIINAVN